MLLTQVLALSAVAAPRLECYLWSITDLKEKLSYYSWSFLSKTQCPLKLTPTLLSPGTCPLWAPGFCRW